MNLVHAPQAYSQQDQARIRDDIEKADQENLKRGRDIELGSGRIIGTSPNGTRLAIVFNDDGTLSTEAA